MVERTKEIKTIVKIVLLSLFLSSCKDGNDKIEIYLTNKKIETTEGIPLHKVLKNDEDFKYIKKVFKDRRVNIDTTNNNLIFFGKFKANLKDLQDKPLIENNEIVGFNLNKSLLCLSESGMKKISKIPSEMKDNFGKQFVICINDDPCITGYFINKNSAIFWSNTYEIYYLPEEVKNKERKFEKYEYDFRFGKNLRKLDSLNENRFIKALKKSNRLIIK